MFIREKELPCGSTALTVDCDSGLRGTFVDFKAQAGRYDPPASKRERVVTVLEGIIRINRQEYRPGETCLIPGRHPFQVESVGLAQLEMLWL